MSQKSGPLPRNPVGQTVNVNFRYPEVAPSLTTTVLAVEFIPPATTITEEEFIETSGALSFQVPPVRVSCHHEEVDDLRSTSVQYTSKGWQLTVAWMISGSLRQEHVYSIPIESVSFTPSVTDLP